MIVDEQNLYTVKLKGVSIIYNIRKATIEDLPLLIPLRLEVLRCANKLPADAPLEKVEENTLAYYRKSFDTQSTFLAFYNDTIVGCGSVSFYSVFPTCDCPNGTRAYIMNMYTREAYRQRGIASALLVELIQDARNYGAGYIALEATDMGRPLYKKHGFVPSKNEMHLP